MLSTESAFIMRGPQAEFQACQARVSELARANKGENTESLTKAGSGTMRQRRVIQFRSVAQRRGFEWAVRQEQNEESGVRIRFLRHRASRPVPALV